MSTRRDLLLYCFIFASVTLINKFVLTELGFRFPTIFQGWQTFVGALMLLALNCIGRVEIDFSSVNRALVGAWLPYLGVYVICIYSGSVALSNMDSFANWSRQFKTCLQKEPVPIFLCLHNVTNVLNIIADRIVIGGKVLTPKEYLSSSLVLVSTLFISQLDTESSESSYVWLLLHVMCSVILVNYPKFFKHIPVCKDSTLLFLCYTFSVIVFLPSMLLLGDYWASHSFPFWSHRAFFCGCALSGLLGAILNILWFAIKDKTHHLCSFAVALTAVGKCAASCFSFLVFPPKSQPDSSYIIWIFANLICAMTLSDVITQSHDVIKPSLSDPDFNGKPKYVSQQV